MKNIIGLLIIAIGLMTFVSCEPIEKRQANRGAVTMADVDKYVSVTPEMRDGKRSNYILLRSEGLQALTQFNYGLGTYVGTNGRVQLVVAGDATIRLTVLSPNGEMLEKDFTVTVDECYDVPPEWALFCGTGSKTWTWNDQLQYVYGNGAQYDHSAPTWWLVPIRDLNGQGAGEGDGATMTFSVNGSALKLNKTSGADAQGSFAFDMSKKMIRNGVTWTIGQLTTRDVSILVGKSRGTFEILTLTDDLLEFAWLTADGNAEFYMFKAVK